MLHDRIFSNDGIKEPEEPGRGGKKGRNHRNETSRESNAQRIRESHVTLCTL